MSDGLECDEQTVRQQAGIYEPSRGSASTDHTGTTAQTIVNFTLEDETLENMLITLTGRDSTGDTRVAFQIPLKAVRRDSESPNAYSVEKGSESYMNNEDTDLDVNVVENGDTNILVQATHSSGGAGTWQWSWQIWTFDVILLS